MKSTIEYDKNIANKFQDTRYYENMQYFIKNKKLIEQEKITLEKEYKKLVLDIVKENNYSFEYEKVFEILKKIYEKNTKYAFGSGKKPLNSNILGLIAEVPLLIAAYNIVRKDPASMTLASLVSKERYEKVDVKQNNFTNKTEQRLDIINLQLIQETSKLIKKGKYPWSTSRRISIDKPGKKGNKRPLIIPLFMDIVVETAIKMVLISIYEPYFDKMNVSFGFRPGKSIQDSISMLTGNNAAGLDKVLEGYIKVAYDKVTKSTLINILGKKIKDKKFLNFIRERLDSEYYDSESKTYLREKIRISQGGIDAPYLWNIYMLEFDEFITQEIKNEIENINIKSLGKGTENKEFINTERIKLLNKGLTLKKILKWIRKTKNSKGKFLDEIKGLMKKPEDKWKEYDKIFLGVMVGGKKILQETNVNTEYNESILLKNLQKKLKLTNHMANKIPFFNKNKIRFRIIYTRFADDWIIVTNLKKQMLEKFKEKISIFLNTQLDATLSEEKTRITVIQKEPAHFLGFEIRSYKRRKIVNYIRNNLQVRVNIAENKVFAGIDKQKILNRLHMKAYCDKSGFPREISKIVNLDTFTIIEKYNSVLLGLVNCYYNCIKNPKSHLSRWIYIIRYSCIKTIAQKHKTTMAAIYKKFAPKNKDKKEENTIEDLVQIKGENELLTQSWKLHTRQSLYENSKSWNFYAYRKDI